MNFDLDSATRSHFFSGALGAVVALRYVPGTTCWERAFNVVTGAVTAGYTAPALIEWFHVQTPGFANASAFFIGLMGMSLVSACIDGLKKLPVAEIVTGWISRKG